MATSNHTPQSDPEELARAQDMWVKFMEMGKYSIIGVVIILAGLGFFFL
jgi:multisubunit Na+/H+ antiporter MnhG subunit